MLFPIERDSVKHFWEEVEPYVSRAIAKGILPIQSAAIKQALLERDFKLFLLLQDGAMMGAGILNIREEMGIKLLNIYMMSHEPGYKEEDKDLETVSQLAASMGIQYVTYFGRPGFFRKHVPDGWKLGQVIMVKEA